MKQAMSAFFFFEGPERKVISFALGKLTTAKGPRICVIKQVLGVAFSFSA